MNTWARPSGSPAATQRSQNPETISVSEVPARPAWVSHADNSVKEGFVHTEIIQIFAVAPTR